MYVAVLSFEIFVKICYGISIWTFTFQYLCFTFPGNRIVYFPRFTVIWDTLVVDGIDVITCGWWTIFNVNTLVCFRIQCLAFRTRFMDYSCLCLMYDLLYYCPGALACEHITGWYIYCDGHDLFTIA